MSSFLADLDLNNLNAPMPRLGRFWHDYAMVFAAVGAVALLALLWAVFLRKRPRHDFHRFGHRAASQTLPSTAANGHAHNRLNGSSRHHRRHHRRQHRPRNPTLAETGGLPHARPLPPPDPSRGAGSGPP